MILYQRHSNGRIEIAAIGHVDEQEFLTACWENDYEIEPGTVRQIYEIIRRRGRAIDFVQSDSKAPGAYRATIALCI